MIRRAENKDIKQLDELLFQVQAIHAKGRPDIFKLGSKKYTDEELRSIIANDNTPIFVFEQDGNIKGYAFCIYQTTEETKQVYFRKTLYIDDLCVNNICRRQGIGSQLYRYVLNTAAENGCGSVTLNVWHLNEEALMFYKSLGMKPLKTMMETQITI